MNENEVFRFKVRIAIPNLSRENKDMINSILDGINKKDEEEKGYLYTVRVKLNNGKVVHATLFSKDKKGPTFEDLKKELDDMGIKDDDYSDNGIMDIILSKDPVENKSVKNDIIDDKLRWDLLPMEEIEDIVKVYHAGAKKYGPNNWQNLDNGFERYRAAMFRHLMEYMKGERVDSDTGCFHLAQCAWNCIAMLWYDKHGKGLMPLNKEEKK